MGSYKKGIEMRARIIEESGVVFNQKGLQLTLDQLAAELQITKGRITNYFPTKDHLFVALSQKYDLRFKEVTSSLTLEEELSFRFLHRLYSAVMDLQYEHRSTIIFAALTNSSQKEMHSQITESYRNNSKGVRYSMESLVQAGLLTPLILDKREFEIFHFNLSTCLLLGLLVLKSTIIRADTKR